jgi:hypothetical protein
LPIYTAQSSSHAKYHANGHTIGRPESTMRFVILHHSAIPTPHFDIMVERTPGGQLATWRSPDWPITSPTEVTPLRDHRRFYLDYQGSIAGERGYVSQAAWGECEVQISANGDWQITCDEFRLTLTPHSSETWIAAPARLA